MKEFHHQVQEIKLSYSPAKFSGTTQKIQCSKDAVDVLLAFYNHDTMACREEFLLLLLNKSHTPLGVIPISNSGVISTVVDIKLIMSITETEPTSETTLQYPNYSEPTLGCIRCH